MTREEAIEKLENEIACMKWVGDFYADCVDGEALEMALEALKREQQEPERKKGYWIKSKDIIKRGTCSCCGWHAITDKIGVVGMPFCPNCGAQMGREPKKGKWQWTAGTYTCTVCSHHAYGKMLEILTGGLQLCPKCGAQMEVEL